jgi:hypothetical protein
VVARTVEWREHDGGSVVHGRCYRVKGLRFGGMWFRRNTSHDDARGWAITVAFECQTDARQKHDDEEVDDDVPKRLRGIVPKCRRRRTALTALGNSEGK